MGCKALGRRTMEMAGRRIPPRRGERKRWAAKRDCTRTLYEDAHIWTRCEHGSPHHAQSASGLWIDRHEEPRGTMGGVRWTHRGQREVRALAEPPQTSATRAQGRREKLGEDTSEAQRGRPEWNGMEAEADRVGGRQVDGRRPMVNPSRPRFADPTSADPAEADRPR
ncbi:hypothetical protein DFH06DRAFT_1301098 [Mycena polygramma]|nr:hypothetical protein DFH06DRAFT_1301098 [Mycena polygramma]